MSEQNKLLKNSEHESDIFEVNFFVKNKIWRHYNISYFFLQIFCLFL